MADQEKMESLVRRLKEKAKEEGGATCACCLGPKPERDILHVGVFLRDEPAVAGKVRAVGYYVCKKCMELIRIHKNKNT